jgi:hypothetical protein
LRGILTAGRRETVGNIARGLLAHGHRFPGQQRFVDFEMIARDQHTVRGDAIALGQHDDVSASDLAAGDADTVAVAYHQRSGAREVAKRFERLLAASLLDDGDGYRDGREAEQHQRFASIPERRVNDRGRDQQREHGLANDLGGDAPRGSAAGRRQLIEAFTSEARVRLGFAQARCQITGCGRHKWSAQSGSRRVDASWSLSIGSLYQAAVSAHIRVRPHGDRQSHDPRPDRRL